MRRVRLRSVCRFFLPQCNGGFKLLWVCLCVRSYRVFWNLCLQIALEWLHDVAWAMFWEEDEARNLVFFRIKWLQPAMKRYLLCGGCGCGRFAFFFAAL